MIKKYKSARIKKLATRDSNTKVRSWKTQARTILRDIEQGNPWEHKDPVEVYGDDGLTFFDSNKSTRNLKRTGSFFGI